MKEIKLTTKDRVYGLLLTVIIGLLAVICMKLNNIEIIITPYNKYILKPKIEQTEQYKVDRLVKDPVFLEQEYQKVMQMEKRFQEEIKNEENNRLDK